MWHVDATTQRLFRCSATVCSTQAAGLQNRYQNDSSTCPLGSAAECLLPSAKMQVRLLCHPTKEQFSPCHITGHAPVRTWVGEQNGAG